MKKFKIISFTIILIVFVSLTACSNKQSGDGTVANKESLDNLSESSFPIVEKPISLNMLVSAGRDTLLWQVVIYRMSFTQQVCQLLICLNMGSRGPLLNSMIN